MYDRAIAAELRSRGHDVVAVTERPDLRSIDDRELLQATSQEQRVIVTENAVHFVSHFHQMLRDGATCYGLILTSPKSMPRKKATIGTYVRALDRELAQRPDETSLLDQILWLTP